MLVWLRFAWVLRRIDARPTVAGIDGALPPEVAWPKLSVVVACRNEEGALRAAISSLLAQDYPSLELVAVDDRSEDATGGILDELSATHPALRVLHLDTLPVGWLGKTNALHQGAAHASGDFLLFTDADVLFAPGTLRRAIAWAVRDDLGHAVALPHFLAPGLLERAFVSLFALFLLVHLRADAIGRPGGRAHIGIGAFNLVRRDAYAAIGGHQLLRFEIADDVKLGLLLARTGARQGCLDSGGLVRVRWQRGFVASMRGLVKNSFAGLEYRWGHTLATAFLVPFLTTFPFAYTLLGAGGLTRALAAASLALSVALHGATARRLAGGRGYEGLLLPVGGLAVAAVVLASALAATLRGAVIWRGTRYDLRELRAACVRAKNWPPGTQGTRDES